MSAILDKPYDPGRAAVCVTAQEDGSEDHPDPLMLKAFCHNFQPRIDRLVEGGLSVDFTAPMSTIFEIDDYLANHYPNGCFYFLTRMHGSPTTGILNSRETGGRFTTRLTGTEQETVHRICQAVIPGGVFVSESCQNGAGKDNLLKYFAQHCRVGVVVIGGKRNLNGLSVRATGNPKDFRFLDPDSDEDITRIYYRAASGPKNIDIGRLNILLLLLGRAPEELDLCYRFLGERGEGGTREECREKISSSGNSENFIRDLKTIQISHADVSKQWKSVLTSFAARANLPDAASLKIDQQRRSYTSAVHNGDTTLDGLQQHSGSRDVYLFLLGMAALEKYQDIFSLLDEEHLPTCIYNLTGLAFHPVPGGSTLQTLSSYIALVKESYQFAKENNLIPQWTNALLAVQNPSIDAYVDALNDFQANAIASDTKFDKITEAIKANQLDALQALLISFGSISEEQRGSAVLDAISVGNLQAVQLLLASGRISQKDRIAAFRCAKTFGKEEMMQLLLASGRIPEAEKQSHYSTSLLAVKGQELIAAVQQGRIDEVSYCLASDIFPDYYQSQAISAAFETNHPELIPLLLSSKGTTDKHREAALCLAVQHGHRNLVRLLLNSNTIVLSRLDGALLSAIQYGHQDIMEMILNVNTPSDFLLYHALNTSINYNQPRMLETLLGFHKFSNQQWNAIAEFAASNGHFQMVELLLGAGKIPEKSKGRILVHAMEQGGLSLLHQLLREAGLGAALDLLPNTSFNPDWQRTLQTLLDSDKFSNEQWSALVMLAAFNGNFQVAEALLDSGKLIPESKGYVFIYAAKYGSFPLLNRLLAEPSIATTLDTHTALLEAAFCGQFAIVEHLLHSLPRFEVDTLVKALAHAAEGGQQTIVDYFFANDLVPMHRIEPLFFNAVHAGNLSIVKALLASQKMSEIYTRLAFKQAEQQQPPNFALLEILCNTGHIDPLSIQKIFFSAVEQGNQEFVEKMRWVCGFSEEIIASALLGAADYGHQGIVSFLFSTVSLDSLNSILLTAKQRGDDENVLIDTLRALPVEIIDSLFVRAIECRQYELFQLFLNSGKLSTAGIARAQQILNAIS